MQGRAIAVAVAGWFLAACRLPPDDPSTASATAADSTDASPTTDALTTTGGSTTSGATTSGSTTSGATTSGSTTNASLECGPPCANPWQLDDWLELDETDDLSQYACLTAVERLILQGDIPPGELAVFANLRKIDTSLEIIAIPGLEDLSAFACLQEVPVLSIADTPALTDLSALGELTTALTLEVLRTGVVALPAFAPGFDGLGGLILEGNPSLVDISGVAAWGTGDVGITVRLRDNAALTSVAPLAKLLAQPRTGEIRVELIDLPVLAALTGLEPIADPSQTAYSLHLGALPLVPDLQPISQLTSIVGLTLAGMPQVTSLADLIKLETAKYVRIGDCMELPPMEGGMDGLTSLTGLDSLVDVYRLNIAGNLNLGSLSGAPLLKELVEINAIGNPALTPAAFDDFLAQLTDPPMQPCFGDWFDCPCYD